MYTELLRLNKDSAILFRNSLQRTTNKPVCDAPIFISNIRSLHVSVLLLSLRSTLTDTHGKDG